MKTTYLFKNQYISEQLLLKKEEQLLFRCTRYFYDDQIARRLDYYEAWRNTHVYQTRTKADNGSINYVGFFFYSELDIVNRFINNNIFNE